VIAHPEPTPLEAATQAVLTSMRIGRYDYGATDAYNAEAEVVIQRELAALLAARDAEWRAAVEAVRKG
jgi:hypothetical protein